MSGSLLCSSILTSFFLSVPLGCEVPLQLELLKHNVLFSILFTLDVVCRAVSTELPVLTPDLPHRLYGGKHVNQGWGEWMRKFMWSWHEQSRHRSMLVPSDLGAATQWVPSCPSRSPTACWSYGEGKKRWLSLGVAAAAGTESNPLLLSSHKASHPFWAETQCEGLPHPQTQQSA